MKTKKLLCVGLSVCIIVQLIYVNYAFATLEDLKEIRVADTTITVKPQLQLILPNGVMNASFKQIISTTIIDYHTKYDFLNNSIYSDFDTRYLISPYTFGIGLQDHVDFEKTFANIKTLQRSRHIKPYVGYNITDTTKLTAATRFQNTYTVSITSHTTLDSGQNLVYSLGMINNTLDKSGDLPKGGTASLELNKAFGHIGGNYDYFLAELYLFSITHPIRNHYLESTLKIGYPMSIIKLPITEIYSMGGYDMMKGYSYNELQGNSMAYAELKYIMPTLLKKSIPGAEFNLFSFYLSLEAGKTGDKNIFDTFNDTRMDFGPGFEVELILFKTLHTKFNLMISKPFDNSGPKMYVSLTTISYFKAKNK